MSFTTVTLPANIAVIPVDTRVLPKVLYLPTVSTNAGRYLVIKDYYGTAANSTITVSTTGTDLLDDYNSKYTFSNAFGSMNFVSDGVRSWRYMNFYDGLYTPISSGGFSPTSIPGLSLWFDPSDVTTLYQNSSLTAPITADGQTVSGMADKSGNGYSATSTNGPVYKTNIKNSLSILRFNGSQWINNVAYSFPNTAYSIFAIGYLSANNGSYQRLLQAYPDGVLFLGTLNGVIATFTGVGGWNGGVAANSPSYTQLSNWYLTEMQLTGSTLYPYVTGNAQTAKGGSTTSAFTNLNIGGANGAYSGQPWNGDIGEILVYNSYLSDSNRQLVEGYLAWKWGLQSQLPADHPYKNAAP